MAPTSSETDFATLSSLESRLRHVEFLLSGTVDDFGRPTPATRPLKHEDTVAMKLEHLEKQLRKLSEHSLLVQGLLGLQKRHPDLFTPSSQSESQMPATLDPEASASIVLAHASAFSETGSRLTSLKDLDASMPAAAKSAMLAELQPRLDGAAGVQEEQAREVGHLRARTAKVLQRWVELQVGMGEEWTEWEERALEAERRVARLEGLRRREQEA